MQPSTSYIIIPIKKKIWKQNGLLVAPKSDLTLSVAQVIVTRDHVKICLIGLYRMKQAFETFFLDLKGVIPSDICKEVSLLEKEGVIAATVYCVDCTITKTGNKRDMCTFSHYHRPVDLLASIFCRMYLDNTFEASQEFCSLTNMLVVAVDCDKSDSDFVGT